MNTLFWEKCKNGFWFITMYSVQFNFRKWSRVFFIICAKIAIKVVRWAYVETGPIQRTTFLPNDITFECGFPVAKIPNLKNKFKFDLTFSLRATEKNIQLVWQFDSSANLDQFCLVEWINVIKIKNDLPFHAFSYPFFALLII